MSDTPFFLSDNQAFGTVTEADDLLHTALNRQVAGDSVTETQYLGFNVPEHNIHGLGYIWHHPNLGVVTGGLMVWQGIKRFSIGAELFDMRAYNNDSVLANDLHEVRLENSYNVRMVEPLRRFHMRYDDGARRNHVDLDFTAVTPPVVFGDGKHFEQGMRVRGRLVLRGQTYEVDCFNVRDRSWAKQRPEQPMAMPPVSWMSGWFGEDFFFNCNLLDHAGSSPLVSGDLAIPAERALNGGWVLRDGRLALVTRARKVIERDPQSLLPHRIELWITEDNGRETAITGELLASCPWAVWPNIHSNISLIRWQAEGRTGHGDCQDVIWTDYVNAIDVHQRAAG